MEDGRIQIKKRFFKAFSNPTRMLIIEALREGEKCVKELSETLGIEQSTVSHNLRCLADCGFVEVNRRGKWRFYSLDKENILPILQHIDKHFEGYAKRLAECKRL